MAPVNFGEEENAAWSEPCPAAARPPRRGCESRCRPVRVLAAGSTNATVATSSENGSMESWAARPRRVTVNAPLLCQMPTVAASPREATGFLVHGCVVHVDCSNGFHESALT